MRMRLYLLVALTAMVMNGADAKDAVFFEKPYLQLGNRPAVKGGVDGLEVQWMGHDVDVKFEFEYGTGGSWQAVPVKMLRRVDFAGTLPHKVFGVSIDGLKPGVTYDYRVKADGKEVFASTAMARKAPGVASKFVLFGDCAQNTVGQRGVAYYTAQEKPDYVLITGDIVYTRGRVSEYQEKFWPIYNADQADVKKGAPILRNTLVVGLVGNHDAQPEVNWDTNPDGLAYYLYWNLPLNGPALSVNGPNTPKLKGNEVVHKKFLEAAGGMYPKMANFSFDYGDVHWTILDANPYVDWDTPEMREWVKQDLKAAAGAKWRLVGLHHPPFNSSRAHFNYQRLRVLADVFEEGKVSAVFAGHVHNYQRSLPLKFVRPAGAKPDKQGILPGSYFLDKEYDGKTRTKPNGVIYVVSGAGGAGLYDPDQTDMRASWQPFTQEFVSNTHSFTVVEATATQLKVKQVSSAGKTVDEWVVGR